MNDYIGLDASPARKAYAMEHHTGRDHRIAAKVMLVMLIALVAWVLFTWGTP